MYHRGHRGWASHEFQEGFLESRPGLVQKLEDGKQTHKTGCQHQGPLGSCSSCRQVYILSPAPSSISHQQRELGSRKGRSNPSPWWHLLAALPPTGAGLSHVPAPLLPHCARHRWVKLVERWLEEQVLGQLPRAQRGTAAERWHNSPSTSGLLAGTCGTGSTCFFQRRAWRPLPLCILQGS